jgi:hypothetical protein
MKRRPTPPIRLLVLSGVFAASVVGGCGFLDVDDQLPSAADSADYSALFIGSSYLGYNELPWMFEQLAREVGRSVYVRTMIVYGSSLGYHSVNTLTLEAIREYDWDFVVLQGGSYGVAHPELSTEGIFSALEILKARIKENDQDTRAAYMMAWAYEDGVEWQNGESETFEEMQQEIYDNTVAWADSLDLVVAPAGWAWREVLKTRTEPHYLHSVDLSHPNLRGSYLTACVFVATMFGQSVRNVGYFAGIPEGEARVLQDVASRVVLDSRDLWNVDPVRASALLRGSLGR